VNIPEFVNSLKRNGYCGPLIIEREVGDQAGRFRDLAHGLSYLRDCLKS
jgi:L-ribulose-5-phosphate 3-epimerase